MSRLEHANMHENHFVVRQLHFLLNKAMELLRRRLLDCAIKQSDFIEIFTAIDRGWIFFSKVGKRFFFLFYRLFRTNYIQRIS